jgi:hypothetical protein
MLTPLKPVTFSPFSGERGFLFPALPEKEYLLPGYQAEF